jgi:phosphoribosylamine--glycine ligase
MKILLLGSGGREHTFAWKITQSEYCDHLYIAPGNAGTAHLGTNLAVSPTDFEAVKTTVLEKDIDLVIVGPEAPLVAGIVDFFNKDEQLRNIAIIGPNQEAAQLEGSKAFAKQFMKEMMIPTAAYREFTNDNKEEGLDYIRRHDYPVVLKADGLAAGKGVIICQNQEEAEKAFLEMLGGKFGEASQKVVVEQFLKGIEFSVFVLTDGENYILLPEAKDYKRIGEGDTGLNTGGMGSVSPVSFVDQALMEKVERSIIRPTVEGLRERGIVYRGFIFFGLIVVDGEPFVIEYNCRMGDPETQVVFPRLKNDLLEVFQAMESGQLATVKVQVDQRAAAAVILVSGGYPEAYEKGKKIEGLDAVRDSLVFHAGTKKVGESVLSNGGRVLAVTSFGSGCKEALEQSYQNVEKITFEGKYYRRDIGFDL